MQITGLELALNRINQIESRFGGQNNCLNEVKSDFEKILQNAGSSVQNTSSDQNKIDLLVKEHCQKNGLDESFVKAVIKAESAYNPSAKSPVGALGLMQLMPSTASVLGVENPLDPAQNIEGGTKYLKQLMDKFGGRKELALAAYNAGPGAVNKYGGVPPYSETQNYVKKVAAFEKQFSGIN